MSLLPKKRARLLSMAPSSRKRWKSCTKASRKSTTSRLSIGADPPRQSRSVRKRNGVRPGFDVVESSWDVMILMKNEGLFARYVPPSSERFPEQFKEKDALITPWRLLPISILFNTELVKAGEAPKNLDELLD